MSDLGEAIGECLDDIDRLLAENDVPITVRAMAAAKVFVDECVVEVRGGSKSDYLGQPWFQAVWDEIAAWYRRRYGAALQRRDDQWPGLVLILGDLYRLQIPLTFWTHRKGNTGWIHFPGELQAGEDPLSWIEKPPNLGELSEEDHLALRAAAGEVVEHTRSIHVERLGASKGGPRFAPLAHAAQSHLAKAVYDLSSGDLQDIHTAMWELHLAMETAFKAFIAQRRIRAARGHSLQALHRAATAASLPPLEPVLFETLPRERESINHRYGEGERPTAAEAYVAYRRALAVVRHCVRHFQRTLHLRNSALQLRGFGTTSS